MWDKIPNKCSTISYEEDSWTIIAHLNEAIVRKIGANGKSSPKFGHMDFYDKIHEDMYWQDTVFEDI